MGIFTNPDVFLQMGRDKTCKHSLEKKDEMNAQTNRLGKFPDTSNTIHCCSTTAATGQEKGKC